MARSCSRPLSVMSAGRQAGTHCQSTRKSSMQPSEASAVRIWFSMTPVRGHAAEVRVMAMTAVCPSMVTARTNPRSTMLTPRSGSMTSDSASRTAVTRSPAASAGTSGAAAGTGGSAGGWSRSVPAVAYRPAGRRVICTRQVGLWIQSATTSSTGSRPAVSACTMARSSSRATDSYVRPGPKRSRARAAMTGLPMMAPSAARPSLFATRICGSSMCSSAASVVPMRGPHSGCGGGRRDEPFERQRLVAELVGGGAVVAGDQAADVEHVPGPVQRDHRPETVAVQAERGEAALLERAADDQLFGVIDEAGALDAVLVLIGPEPVDIAERLALAEHVAGRGTSVPDGAVVMLDAHASPVPRQVLGGDVSDGIDTGRCRGEVLIDGDTVPGRQPGLLR